ncbi:hypothetical protein TA3x_003689 [Tundrisphaera sp. TA3]|uniref:hypothetical protein n=1 Tax=Tundrisphaera sp. TA3 TaxID=3435775 RepID=UPI003EBEB948
MLQIVGLQVIMYLVAQQGPNKDANYLETVFKSNFDLVERGAFKFSALYGIAESYDDAARAKLDREVKGSGFYAFDEKNVVYKIHYEKDDVLSTTGSLPGLQTSVELVNAQILTDRTGTCLDLATTVDKEKNLVRSSVEIFEDKDQQLFLTWLNFLMPYGFNGSSTELLCDLQSVNNGAASIIESSIKADQSGAGNKTIAIRYDGGFQRDFMIDLLKGGIPIFMEEKDVTGQIINMVAFDDIRKVQDRVWIPFKKISYNPIKKTARILVLEEIDIEKNPKQEVFSLHFDEKYNIPNRTKSVVYYGLDNFSFKNNFSTPVSTRPLNIKQNQPSSSAGPIMPGEMKTTRWTSTLVAATIGIICLVAFAFHRWNRRRA